MTIVVIGDNTGNDYTGTEDTYIDSNAATTNYGTGVEMEVTEYNSSIHRYSLLSFSGLSNITGPVTVSSATVSLRLMNASGANHTIDFYRLLRNWVEGQATWNDYATSAAWQTAGGLGANDRSGTSSSSITVGTTYQYYDFTGTQLNTDFENFINGSVSNYGHHVDRTDGTDDSSWRVFRTSDNVDGQRPYVTIDYTAGGGGGTNPKGPLSNPLSGPFGGPI